MKFGKTIESSSKELPAGWQPYLIQYKLLKKSIKGIVQELENTFDSLNLSTPVFKDADAASIVSDGSVLTNNDGKPVSDHGPELVDTEQKGCDERDGKPLSHMLDGQPGSPEIVEYHIERDKEGIIHPFITVKIRATSSPDGSPRIVELSEDSSSTKMQDTGSEDLSSSPRSPVSPKVSKLLDEDSCEAHGSEESIPLHQYDGFGISMSGSGSSGNSPDSKPTETKISEDATETQLTLRLQQDQRFFDQLLYYISQIQEFEKQYAKSYSSNVSTLGADLSAVTSPFKHDFQVWREVFRLYTEADIWSHATGDHRTTNTSKEGQMRFAEFTDHIEKLGLAKKFRDPASGALLVKFLQLNSELIWMKLLQEMNTAAARKIIKKHDKRTHLIAKTQFPQLVTLDATTLTNALAYTIHCELVGIVPQIDDYLCPMCLNIAWRPLRLECNHIFCSRCVVKASRRRMFNCPVCRSKGAIYKAGVQNIDNALLNFLRLYFPAEIKEKQSDVQDEISQNETQVINSIYSSNDKACIIM